MDVTIVTGGPGLPIWDWRVAADLFFGGMGVGAFLFAVLADWRYQGKYSRICQTAALLAPLFVVAGLFFLMLKMGRPESVYLTYLSFVPTSPIWWGGIFQLVLVLGSAIYAWHWVHPQRGTRRRRTLGWALTPIALVVGAYHGFVLSVFQARPLWNTGPTVVAAVLGFFTTGIAAILLVHLVRMKIAGRLGDAAWVAEFLDDMREVRFVLGAALLLQLFTIFVWWISLAYGGLWAGEALAAANGAVGPLFWIVGIGIGLLLPLLLGAYVALQGRRAGLGLEINMVWVTSALILVGGMVLRWAVVIGGQQDLTQRALF